MDLKQLDYFVHVADLGSFTKAASLLSVAQSALSHQVRRLEVELKQTLLNRNGRGVTPTDAGKRLLGHARGILTQASRARDELAETRGTPVGHAVLALPASSARLLALPMLESFRGFFPNASFGMVEGLSAYVVEWLIAGRVDIGLVYNPTPSPQIEIIPVREQEMVLVSSTAGMKPPVSRRVKTDDLVRFPLIIPSRPNANRMRVEALLARRGLKPQIAFEIDGVASVLDLVHAGYGYTILPLSSLRDENLARNFIATPIVNPKLTIQLSLVISSQRPTTPLTKGLLQLVHATVLQVLFGESAKQ